MVSILTHPGEMLAEELLIPMKITQRGIAEAIDVPYETTIAAFEEDKSAMQVFHPIEALKRDVLT